LMVCVLLMTVQRTMTLLLWHLQRLKQLV
jgi:hypothetical protein